MLTAGDEFGRSQRGNNNAYCHDSELTWLGWDRADWQQDLHRVTRRLLQLRRENPALRPSASRRLGENVPSASQMDWYDADGGTMSEDDWNSPASAPCSTWPQAPPNTKRSTASCLSCTPLESADRRHPPAHEGVIVVHTALGFQPRQRRRGVHSTTLRRGRSGYAPARRYAAGRH